MRITVSRKPTLPTRVTLLTKEASKNIVDFSGDEGELLVRYENGATIICCGLGEKISCTTAAIRAAAAKAVQKALDLKRNAVSLICAPNTAGGEAGQGAALEGALLGAYRFVKYKSEKPIGLDRLECVGDNLTPVQVRSIETVCAAVAYARDLVNENASTMTPERLAAEARAIGRAARMRVTVLDEKEIAKRGLGLLAAVGQGSPTPPRLIVIEYNGDRSSAKKTAIVGKGITFDSGGQNLKPTGHIETMRLDMAGAAAVLGVMKTIAALKLRVNVVGCIPAAHNAIGCRAYFPGDIHQSFAGKTVEICSTDAEGRLVLADAIAFCREKYHPAQIVDLATLTGAILSSFGELVAGLFSNNDRLASALFGAGQNTGERLWRLPLYKEYSDSLKGDFADLRNLSKFKKGYAGAITGAAFIQEFAGNVPWAHLDIAGTAWNEGGPRGEIPQYATGFGVRLLVDFFSNR